MKQLSQSIQYKPDLHIGKCLILKTQIVLNLNVLICFCTLHISLCILQVNNVPIGLIQWLYS